GQMGLAVFHTYLKNNSVVDKDRFLQFVNWFYNHRHSDKHLGVRWLTEVPLPQYHNPGSWQSAFAQGRGISILLRGFQITGEKKFATMAEKALVPFAKPVSEGGVTAYTQWGPFYEEYTAEVPTLVLNGMIFSLCGIYDFVRVFPENDQAQKLFSDGIQTLKNILPEYDLGYWSRYNLCKAQWYPEVDPATVGYQRLHVLQFNMLHQLTGESIFKTYAELFQKQDNIYNMIKMYKVKYSALKKLKRL
ncbi:D-glucuronyl C5-epimerase family protein, partial [bacterium]|nr:D-glucuronyl C5-epimerase family protein [bacterium]